MSDSESGPTPGYEVQRKMLELQEQRVFYKIDLDQIATQPTTFFRTPQVSPNLKDQRADKR